MIVERPYGGHIVPILLSQAALDRIPEDLLDRLVSCWLSIEDEDLAPDMAGIRPKLQAPGQGVRDFVIAEESGRGLPGLVNLVGIDSPGLTSALAIADKIARMIG